MVDGHDYHAVQEQSGDGKGKKKRTESIVQRTAKLNSNKRKKQLTPAQLAAIKQRKIRTGCRA